MFNTEVKYWTDSEISSKELYPVVQRIRSLSNYPWCEGDSQQTLPRDPFKESLTAGKTCYNITFSIRSRADVHNLGDLSSFY